MKRHSLLYTLFAGAVVALPVACSSDATSEAPQVEATQTVTAALEADADCEAQVYEAEGMYHSVGGPVEDGWNIWSEGYISDTHDFEGGTTTITAVVRGQFAGGAAPNMVITVDDEEVYSTGVGSSSWTPYNFTFEAAAGEQEIRIYFTNDYYFGGQDRNLYVDKLIVGCGLGLCMNGVVDPGEECDDGSQTSNDSCKTDCTWNVCGDGVTYNLETDANNPNPIEECDDGNDVDDDGCTNACTLPACGDGILQGDEECDDGNDVDDDACSNECVANEIAECGNGVVEIGEQCDDGNDVNTDECTNACTLAACGDAIVQDGEDCDDGNTDNNDSCTVTCTFNGCGDGFVYEEITNDANPNPIEECDDGNDVDDDSCSNTCELNGYCGDGILQDGEECDDANDINDDQCTNECTSPECGDGIVQDGEGCDDGNVVDGDGCSSECLTESAVSASLNVSTNWGTGYCATIEIENGAATAASSWSVVLDTNGGTIYTTWNGNYSANTGNVTVSPVGWNDGIPAGGTNESAGFCVNIAQGGAEASVVSAEATY